MAIGTLPQPKIYSGHRHPSGLAVYVDDRPLRHVFLHSPTGLEWGFGGAGPGDLALSILCEHFQEWPTPCALSHGRFTAQPVYQDFKWAFVANFPHEGCELQSWQIKQFLRQHHAVLHEAARSIRSVTVAGLISEVHQ